MAKKQSVHRKQDAQQAIDKQAENEAVISKALYELIIAIGNIEPTDGQPRTLDRALTKNYTAEIIHGIKKPALLEKWAKTITDAEILFTVLKKLHSLPQKEPIKGNEIDPYISLNNSTQHFAMQVWTELNSGDYSNALEILENQSDHKSDITPLLSAVGLVFWYVTGREAWLKAGEPAQLSETDKAEIKKLLEESVEFYSISRTAEERVEYLQKIIERAESGIIPRVKAYPLDKQIIPNDYITNELMKNSVNIIGKGQLEMPVMGEKSQIRTAVIVSFVDSEGLRINGELSYYDRQVYNAICSLYKLGNDQHIITPAIVYRAMTGDNTAQLSPDQMKDVKDSIEKMRAIGVKLNANAEFEKRGIDGSKSRIGKLKADKYRFLVPYDRIEVEINGKFIKMPDVITESGSDITEGADKTIIKSKSNYKSEAYIIYEKPILLEYAELTGQLMTVDAKLLTIREVDEDGKIGKPLSNTRKRIEIIGYLLSRIGPIEYSNAIANKRFYNYQYRKRKNKSLPEKTVDNFNRLSNRILFDTIYEAIGITNTDKGNTRHARDFVYKCLDYWKAMEYIKSYNIIKDGRKIKGVEIES